MYYDDRVCPACQIILQSGTDICRKCGRKIEANKTLIFFDIPEKVYHYLVLHIGPWWAGAIAVLLAMILFVLILFKFIIKALLERQ